MSVSKDPYAINGDGTAQDAAAFQQALWTDTGKMAALEQEPEVLKVVKGQDLKAFQDLLKTVYAVSCNILMQSLILIECWQTKDRT